MLLSGRDVNIEMLARSCLSMTHRDTECLSFSKKGYSRDNEVVMEQDDSDVRFSFINNMSKKNHNLCCSYCNHKEFMRLDYMSNRMYFVRLLAGGEAHCFLQSYYVGYDDSILNEIGRPAESIERNMAKVECTERKGADPADSQAREVRDVGKLEYENSQSKLSFEFLDTEPPSVCTKKMAFVSRTKAPKMQPPKIGKSKRSCKPLPNAAFLFKYLSPPERTETTAWVDNYEKQMADLLKFRNPGDCRKKSGVRGSFHERISDEDMFIGKEAVGFESDCVRHPKYKERTYVEAGGSVHEDGYSEPTRIRVRRSFHWKLPLAWLDSGRLMTKSLAVRANREAGNFFTNFWKNSSEESELMSEPRLRSHGEGALSDCSPRPHKGHVCHYHLKNHRDRKRHLMKRHNRPTKRHKSSCQPMGQPSTTFWGPKGDAGRTKMAAKAQGKVTDSLMPSAGSFSAEAPRTLGMEQQVYSVKPVMTETYITG